MSQDPANQLRQHGLQVTAQRLAVMRAVSAQPHCTAEAVAEAVRTQIGSISRQGVYDALATLVEKGLIRRIQPAGSPALHEDRVDDNHHHVICQHCGQTADVECSIGWSHRDKAAACSGYQIEHMEVIYRGTCPTCLARQAPEAAASQEGG